MSAAERTRQRDAATDFLRGLGVWVILVDHLHPNFWSHFTLQQLGFSDFAEIFVFLSGFIGAGMYQRALVVGGIPAALMKLRYRMTRLYIAHIASLASILAILAFFAARGLRIGDPVMYTWMLNPPKYFARAAVLLYAPHLNALLPLYIFAAPVMLLAVIALNRRPVLTLTASFAIWIAGQFHILESPLMTRGEAWYFDPLAWHFLFVAGAAAWMYAPRVQDFIRKRWVLYVAACFVAISCALKLAALWPVTQALLEANGFADILVRDAGKPHLAAYRLVHFFCLAILATAFLAKHRGWLQSRVARLAIDCGRDSLFIYSASLVLAMLLNVALTATHAGRLLQLGATSAGLVSIFVLTRRHQIAAALDVSKPEQSRVGPTPLREPL